MAMYHTRAAKLKPLVQAANFTPEQLTLIQKMMGGCSQLRQRKVIDSFLECMLPDNMELVQDRENKITLGSGFSFYPQYVIEKGTEIPKRTIPQTEAVCEICKQNKPDRIQFNKMMCAGCAGDSGEDD